jgi:nucleotide-binding universal stress UspA family protein
VSARASFERRCLVAPEAAAGIFDRVLCGVDGTAESLEAFRQAARLRDPAGTLAVVSAVDLALAAQAGWAATPAAVDVEQEADRALEAARREVPEAAVRSLRGRPVEVLLAEAKRLQATLIALGSHRHRRAIGIALGGVATTMLHEAPCSVLAARPPADAAGFPRSIVVGVDGSPESAVAAAVAFGLGKRFGAEVWPVASTGGKELDLDAVRAIATGVVLDKRRPVDVLVTAASDSDLLVVGSRGLHGVRALGSVSERVAHQAPCSVLVVRPPIVSTDER